MKSLYSKVIYLFIFFTCITLASTPEEGIFAVISPAVTFDNRPMLWKNRNSDSTNTALHAFRGKKYDFIGLIKNNDTTAVLAGQNTSGFALVFNTAMDRKNTNSTNPAILVKSALGECATVQEFQDLLNTQTGPSLYGCFDNRGNCAVFESTSDSVIQFNVSNPETAPNGFLVRQQFSMSALTQLESDSWPYHRTKHLLTQQAERKNIAPQYLLQVVARDVTSKDLDPAPLPFDGRYKDAPKQFVKTENTIKSYRTTNTFVFYGSSPNKPGQAGFYYIAGDPICGVAVPLWPDCGEVPKSLQGNGYFSTSSAIEAIHKRIYHKSKWPHYFDSKLLAKGNKSVYKRNLEFEQKMLNTISSEADNNKLLETQQSWAQQAFKLLK